MPTMTAHSEPRESEVIPRWEELPDGLQLDHNCDQAVIASLASNNDLLEAQPFQHAGTPDPEDRPVSDPAPQGDPSCQPLTDTPADQGDPSLVTVTSETPAPAGAMCECCDQPAARQLLDGNYCADHAALDFPARYDAYKRYRAEVAPRPLVWADREAAR